MSKPKLFLNRTDYLSSQLHPIYTYIRKNYRAPRYKHLSAGSTTFDYISKKPKYPPWSSLRHQNHGASWVFAQGDFLIRLPHIWVSTYSIVECLHIYFTRTWPPTDPSFQAEILSRFPVTLFEVPVRPKS